MVFNYHDTRYYDFFYFSSAVSQEEVRSRAESAAKSPRNFCLCHMFIIAEVLLI